MSTRSRAFPWFGPRRPRPIQDLSTIALAHDRLREQDMIEMPRLEVSFLIDLNHWWWGVDGELIPVAKILRSKF